MLTEQQQKVLDEMLEYIKKKENYLLSSEDRRIGKTITLNELAFTLQALGYKVFILTPYQNQEYFANSFISLGSWGFSGKFTDNSVVIADEAKYEMMYEFLDYCKYRNIPVIGYINFNRGKRVLIKPIDDFKIEYECNWFE